MEGYLTLVQIPNRLILNQHYFSEVGRLDNLISISGKNSYFKTSKCPKL